MKTKQLLEPFVMFCAVAAVAGCASTERRVSQSPINEKNLQRDEAPTLAVVSQPGILHERAFQKLDLNTNGVVTLDEWQRFDTTAGARENFSALDEYGDGQIHTTEFLRQAPKYSKPYRFFEGTTPPSQSDPLRDTGELRPLGLQLFSIQF